MPVKAKNLDFLPDEAEQDSLHASQSGVREGQKGPRFSSVVDNESHSTAPVVSVETMWGATILTCTQLPMIQQEDLFPSSINKGQVGHFHLAVTRWHSSNPPFAETVSEKASQSRFK